MSFISQLFHPMVKATDNNVNCTSVYGCDGCYGCYGCDGCRGCYGCYGCDGCRGCRGCRGCDGCDGCDGCRGCRGCDGCDGCYYSFGLKNCKATFKALFCVDLFGDKFKLFNKSITESRFEELNTKLCSFFWYPKQTNAFELYEKNGNQWSKIDTSKLSTKYWNDSWSDCPKEMVEYIKGLPEFDSAIFEAITGIKVEDKSEAKQKAQQLEDEAAKLLQHAKELRATL